VLDDGFVEVHQDPHIAPQSEISWPRIRSQVTVKGVVKVYEAKWRPRLGFGSKFQPASGSGLVSRGFKTYSYT
jgi:hypothetical protein